MEEIITLKWKEGELVLLDQTILPNKVAYVECKNLEDVYRAIQTMIVRGAPAIGVAAGYGMVLAANDYKGVEEEPFLQYMKEKGEYLKSSRPTAINLMWAVDRILKKMEECPELSLDNLKKKWNRKQLQFMRKTSGRIEVLGKSCSVF